MSNESGYSAQKNLSSVQLLAEVPTLIETLLSAIFSGALLLYVDLLDSLGYIIRYALIIVLSKKLSENLQFEYNYGIGKIEAISSIFADSIVLFGMILTLFLSVYSLFYPGKPSEILIAVVGVKLYDLMWDLAIFGKQRKIFKNTPSTLSETNYAAALGDLLFDSFAWVSLLIMWLLRNGPIVGYISPVVSIGVAVYLMTGCIKRIKSSLNELTDKTLPEEQQIKILKVLTAHFNSYSQVGSIDSRKIGEITRVDINLAFENDTKVEDILNLQKQIQDELDSRFGKCIINIIICDK